MDKNKFDYLKLENVAEDLGYINTTMQLMNEEFDELYSLMCKVNNASNELEKKQASKLLLSQLFTRYDVIDSLQVLASRQLDNQIDRVHKLTDDYIADVQQTNIKN